MRSAHVPAKPLQPDIFPMHPKSLDLIGVNSERKTLQRKNVSHGERDPVSRYSRAGVHGGSGSGITGRRRQVRSGDIFALARSGPITRGKTLSFQIDIPPSPGEPALSES